jgi:anthranilate synthase component 1
VTPAASVVIAALRASPRVGTARAPNVFPVFREFIADLETPVSTLLKVRAHFASGAHPGRCFLLESVEGGERVARYSFVGAGPSRVLVCGGSGAGAADVDPLVALERALGESRLLEIPGISLPAFTGGAVGFVGYDCVRFFEPRVAPAIDAQPRALDLPDALFMLVDTVVVFDHVRHTIKVVSHGRLPDGWGAGAAADDDAAAVAAHAAAASAIEAVAQCLAGAVPPSAQFPPPAAPSSSLLRPAELSPPRRSASVEPMSGSPAPLDWAAGSNMGKAGYEAAVASLRGNIVDGDIIQAVVSQRISLKVPPGCTASALDIYRQLRILNPSPYMFYLECGDGLTVVGASPEMLVKVERNGVATTHPIAGTRRRGMSPEEDAALATELLADTKERAEHIMLVDLGRNDIGRVSAPGSVKVTSLMQIERYSHVMHIVSRVSSLLAPGKTAFDAFRSVFPAGTVSGAPKVRAVELVAALEPSRRGIYAGAVGVFGYDGAIDTAIAIRTLLVEGDTVHLQAGAGIVYDSVPASEHEETIVKLRATKRAVEAAIHRGL